MAYGECLISEDKNYTAKSSGILICLFLVILDVEVPVLQLVVSCNFVEVTGNMDEYRTGNMSKAQILSSKALLSSSMLL